MDTFQGLLIPHNLIWDVECNLNKITWKIGIEVNRYF
jgi:hypothetical protein